jgi:hypothetical protein
MKAGNSARPTILALLLWRLHANDIGCPVADRGGKAQAIGGESDCKNMVPPRVAEADRLPECPIPRVPFSSDGVDVPPVTRLRQSGAKVMCAAGSPPGSNVRHSFPVGQSQRTKAALPESTSHVLIQPSSPPLASTVPVESKAKA